MVIHYHLTVSSASLSNDELLRGLKLPSDNVVVGGWAFSEVGDNAVVYLMVKGVPYASITPFIKRKDVSLIFTGRSEVSGFYLSTIVPGDLSVNDIDVVVSNGKGQMKNIK